MTVSNNRMLTATELLTEGLFSVMNRIMLTVADSRIVTATGVLCYK